MVTYTSDAPKMKSARVYNSEKTLIFKEKHDEMSKGENSKWIISLNHILEFNRGTSSSKDSSNSASDSHSDSSEYGMDVSVEVAGWGETVGVKASFETKQDKLRPC